MAIYGQGRAGAVVAAQSMKGMLNARKREPEGTKPEAPTAEERQATAERLDKKRKRREAAGKRSYQK